MRVRGGEELRRGEEGEQKPPPDLESAEGIFLIHVLLPSRPLQAESSGSCTDRLGLSHPTAGLELLSWLSQVISSLGCY